MHPVIQTVFPQDLHSPRWGGSKKGVPIQWRLEEGEIHRVLHDPERVCDEIEDASVRAISPPRKPGYEMLRGSYA